MAITNPESPIEKIFRETYNDWINNETYVTKELGVDKIFGLQQQVEIYSVYKKRRNKYIVDFYEPTTKIIIELDGHQYHSKREQFIKDRRRDRELLLNGYTTIRFAGAECNKENIVSVLNDVYNTYCMVILRNGKNDNSIIDEVGDIF